MMCVYVCFMCNIYSLDIIDVNNISRGLQNDISQRHAFQCTTTCFFASLCLHVYDPHSYVCEKNDMHNVVKTIFCHRHAHVSDMQCHRHAQKYHRHACHRHTSPTWMSTTCTICHRYACQGLVDNVQGHECHRLYEDACRCTNRVVHRLTK